MRFGPVPVAQAEGGLLAYSLRMPGKALKKGHRLTEADLAELAGAGIAEVTVARLDPGDIAENEAAEALAKALVSGADGLVLDPAFTGRVNIRADGPGVVQIDADAINALNAIDPMITLATVPPWQRVVKGTMAGTVKVISYAVAADALTRACDVGRGALSLRRPVIGAADLIVTQVPGQPARRDDKGIAAVAGRLAALGAALATSRVVAHETEAVAEALAASRSGLVLILTASATSDARDVAPAALAEAGGRLIRFGMPVDPGNLLFIGDLADRPVIGLPGCARSPALNGADWVLERIVCGVPVGDADIAAMGVGGLLKEIPSRPQPRDGPRR